MLTYREHKVEGFLAEHIKKLWVLDNSAGNLPENGKAVLPNGCFNLAIVDGNGARIETCVARFDLVNGPYFCGQMTKAVQVNVKPHTKITIIQLLPWVPSLITDTDLSSLKDRIVPLPAVADQVRILRRNGTYTDEQALISKLQDKAPLMLQGADEKATLKDIFSFILTSEASITVKDLALQAGISERLLQKRFKQATGLSPKEYLKIIKLRATVDMLAYPEKEPQTGTTVAHNSDYYDQAHFINVFRNITSTTPKKFCPSDYYLTLKED